MGSNGTAPRYICTVGKDVPRILYDSYRTALEYSLREDLPEKGLQHQAVLPAVHVQPAICTDTGLGAKKPFQMGFYEPD